MEADTEVGKKSSGIKLSKGKTHYLISNTAGEDNSCEEEVCWQCKNLNVIGEKWVDLIENLLWRHALGAENGEDKLRIKQMR